MKIFARIGKEYLTHARTVFGQSISYDGMMDGFKNLGIECFSEFPTGSYPTAEQHIPDNPGDYLELWYGNPDMYRIDMDAPRRGLVAYVRCGECLLPKDNLNKCDLIFTASTSSRDYHQKYLDPPIHVLSGGIKTELFYYIERDYEASPFVFLHVGSTQWRKGSDMACEAFVKAFPTQSDVELLIISPGPTEMFEELKLKYKADSRFRFEVNAVMDRSQMLSEYYAKGHCLVYPSVTEGWGRCIAEAMATGMPSIVSRWSSMLDQFTSECGWWIEMSDDYTTGFRLASKDDLTRKMQTAYNDRSACCKRGKNAAAFAKDNLTWEVGIRKILPILEIYNGETDFSSN